MPYESNNIQCQKTVTRWSLATFRLCLRKDNQGLIIEKDRAWYNLSTKTSTRGKILLVLYLLDKKK